MNTYSASYRYRFVLLLPLAAGILLATAAVGAAQVPVRSDTVRTDTDRPGAMTQQEQERMRRQQGGGGPPASGSQAPAQEGQVDFQARDSLTFSFGDNRVATLYGSSKVNHSAGELTAGKSR